MVYVWHLCIPLVPLSLQVTMVIMHDVLPVRGGGGMWEDTIRDEMFLVQRHRAKNARKPMSQVFVQNPFRIVTRAGNPSKAILAVAKSRKEIMNDYDALLEACELEGV